MKLYYYIMKLYSAVKDGMKCVELDTEYFKGWYRLATSYLKSGLLDKCRETLSHCEKHFDTDHLKKKKIHEMKNNVDHVRNVWINSQ